MLKGLNNSLYEHLDPTLRTLFVCLTGGNFRAACKYPTEQISYSLLNNVDLINSPYGQFISSLWRGSESRVNTEIHIKTHYQEVKDLLYSGITIDLPNGGNEKFNILPVMCADLCFIKDVIGKCSCTALYGCYYCKKKKISEWDQDQCQKKEGQTMKLGEKAFNTLGENPDHDSKEFTAFQQKNYGQYVSLFLPQKYFY